MNKSATSLKTKQLSERKFFFHFPLLNAIETFTALSESEARHQLINSSFAPYYGQAVLLNPDDRR